MSIPPPPPVPPRPYEYGSPESSSSGGPPPIPPLPPNYRPDTNFDLQPHFADPLVAPRPQKLQPDLPANMARTLDEQMSYNRMTTPQPYSNYPQPSQPPPMNPAYNPGGFAMPSPNPNIIRGPSPRPPGPPGPPPNGGGWVSPPTAAPYNPPQRTDSFTQAMGALSFGPRPQPQAQNRPISSFSGYGIPPKSPSPPRLPQQAAGPPSLTAPLPTIATLQAEINSIQVPTVDPAAKMAWARDVLSLVNRAQQAAAGGASNGGGSGTDPLPGPARILDDNLARLADVAVSLILQIAGSVPTPLPTGQRIPPAVAEAIYLRAVVTAAGSFPQHIQQNPRIAFRDFETAAKAGHHAAWFRLGRDYENFNDDVHAKECFERGVKLGVESCLYRMGMAHLMGQLGLTVNQELAVSLLHKAAALATIDVPQPAYVYGLLLLGEFKHVTIPAHLFAPYIPPTSNLQLEARKHLERAAYLNFAPAQYKLGHAYEFAMPPFPYDPLLSVQYYSLASQQGEVEADMALSKWFLCGAEGAFEKDEGLAYTFAEKAARKGLSSAEFAMGYYKEVGVGGPVEVEAAKKWYAKAAAHGNADAQERLAALDHPVPQALSRIEHDSITESKLVRKRTQAKQRSDAMGASQQRRPTMPGPDVNQIVEDIRQQGGGRPPQAHAATLPPNANPQQKPPRQGIAHHQQQRYSLSDTGYQPPPSGAGGVGRGGGGRIVSNPMAPQSQSPSQATTPLPAVSAPTPASGVKYNTFAEMGVQSAKAEDKECVIM